MQNELETVAWLKTGNRHVQVPVTVCFELDGYKPLGLWVEDEHGADITTEIEQSEYDLLVEKAERHAVEQYTEVAEMMSEGER